LGRVERSHTLGKRIARVV